MEYLFPLLDRQEIAEETMEFTFGKTDPTYTYKSGQHTDWTLLNPPHTDDEGNTRTFSFVSAPHEKVLRIATRMRTSAFKNSLKEIPLGTKLQAKEPMGRMTLHQNTAKPAVFLVGGIGITPFMSIINDALYRQTGHLMYLFYSNKNEKTTAFWDELQHLESLHDNFHFIPSFTDQTPNGWQGEIGRVNAEMVNKHVDSIHEAVAYTAGPPLMVKAMIELAESLGISEEFIRSEDFAGY